MLTYCLFIDYILIISKPDANQWGRKGGVKKNKVILFAPFYNQKTSSFKSIIHIIL